MTISLIIPAYNEEAYIGACVESVLEHAPRNLIEVIVVCNACTDRTAEIAARYPGVRVLHENRKGTGYARQAGFDASTGDIIAYIDADARIVADWFPSLEHEFSTDASLVSLSGPSRFYDLEEWKDALLYYVWWKTCAMAGHRYGRFNIAGGNFAVRRTALESIGGFDTSIPFWGDDTDLGRRLGDAGNAKFTTSFRNYSSARRLKNEGALKLSTNYAMNFISQAYFQKTFTSGYGEHDWTKAPVRATSRRWSAVVAKAKKAASYARSGSMKLPK